MNIKDKNIAYWHVYAPCVARKISIDHTKLGIVMQDQLLYVQKMFKMFSSRTLFYVIFNILPPRCCLYDPYASASLAVELAFTAFLHEKKVSPPATADLHLQTALNGFCAHHFYHV